MSASSHFISRLISDKMCEGKSTGMCEPFSDELQAILAFLGMVVFVFLYYYFKKKDKEAEQQKQ